MCSISIIASALGYGGVTFVNSVTGQSRNTIVAETNYDKLPKSFYLDPDQYLEAFGSMVEQVMEMSRAAYDFCAKRGETKKTAGLVSLFVEEMGINAVKHGFDSVKHGRIEMRLVLK